MGRWVILLVGFGATGFGATGCSFVPEVSHQPTLHNPFPQLSKVAVAPFFNQSTEATVDGRQFALGYANELQLVPGFEVVPVDVVERAIRDFGIQFASGGDARRLAQLLEVDVVVVGSITDYSPYYPPRCGLRVEWYAANPGFHPVPAGYGLPWGTPDEAEIPARLVFEAELALAKEQLATQTPVYAPLEEAGVLRDISPAWDSPDTRGVLSDTGRVSDSTGMDSLAAGPATGPPRNWPDARGFVSPPPSDQPPSPWPTSAAVLSHSRTYNGHDPDFTEALANYYYFRDDARLSGWQGYLERSDDFIRFCCHMHLWEMLSARGGAGETRVVWRWPSVR